MFFLHEELMLGVGEFELGLLLSGLQEETKGRKERDHEGQDDESISSNDDDVRGGENGPFDRHLSFSSLVVVVVVFVFVFMIGYGDR